MDIPRFLICSVAVGVAFAGCGSTTSDKAGGKGDDVRVLRLANANEEATELEPFAAEVERRSGGRLKIEFVNEYARRGNDDPEPTILADVRAGKIDLAWVGTRAFNAEGVDAFDPLTAPFAVADYDTEQRVLASPVAGAMLGAADGAGVRGVAILPGPLRYLAMREPWSGPADLEGKRIDASSGIVSDALEAVGAVPVVSGTGAKLDGIDGTEQHLPSFVGNFYAHEVPYVGDQALWPRPLVVVAAPKLWEALDTDDRELLQSAGRAALDPSLEQLRAADAAALPKLCAAGAKLSAIDREALRSAMEPALAGLRSNRAAAKSLTSIDEQRGGAATPALACPQATQPKGGLPAGTYTWTLTEKDARTKPGGKEYPADRLPVVFRAEVTAGHLILRESARGGSEEIGLEADYSTFKDRIDVDNGTITGRWKVDDEGNLHFSEIKPAGGDTFVFATHPWKRVK